MSNIIVERYVRALFELCEELKELKTLERDVETLIKLYTQSEDIRSLCTSVLFSKEEKKRALDAVSQTLSLSPQLRSFLGVLALNGRTALLRDCLKSLSMKIKHHKGILSVDLVSANPLEKKQQDEIYALVKQFVSSEIEMNTAVQPDLLGGFILTIGSQVYDTSVQTKLEELRTIMKEA